MNLLLRVDYQLRARQPVGPCTLPRRGFLPYAAEETSKQAYTGNTVLSEFKLARAAARDSRIMRPRACVQ